MSEASPRAHWPQALQDEFEVWNNSGVVGSTLVSESDRVRVWHLHIPVGKRCHFHRHVLHYFWTVLAAGKARGYFSGGRIVDVEHYVGETKHFKYAKGEYMIHSVENIGESDLRFTTVEFLDSPNQPLPIPEGIRLVVPAAA
jgi:beta-alanine degradation protein BauB